MAKLRIDISGRRGLLERYQGDLNDTAVQPQLRYTGQQGQFAEGIFNPTKVYGYINPSNANFATLTGTVAATINAIQYEAGTDVVYLSEEGENILQLAGMDDTSLANYLTVTNSGDTIKDMLLYEMNGRKALLYAIDSGDPAYEIDPNALTSTTPDEYFGGIGGMYVGFKMLGDTDDDVIVESNEAEVATTSSTINANSTTLDDGTAYSTKLAQAFNTDTIISNIVDKVALRLVRYGGTGSGITIKLSIQTEADRNAGLFTYQGAWATATGYSVNDTVLSGSITYQCIQAHTSGASSEPEVGGSTESYWQRFGAPSGTEVASTTIDATTIPDNTSNLPGFSYDALANLLTIDRTVFTFSSNVTLSANTTYWLVLEESGSVMTATDNIGWLTTVNDNAAYVASAEGDYAKAYYTRFSTLHWENVNTNDQGDYESRDFLFLKTRVDDWSMNIADGHFIVQPNQTNFLYLAENALMYWFVGNRVHTFDGGITGGRIGRANKEVLTFPSYINVADVAETRSRMYIGIQSSDITSGEDDRYYTAREAGVFVWDRNSRIFGGTDFYPASGAKEIKKVFKSSNGDVKIITVNNSGFAEIREIRGNQYAVIHTFEQQGFPSSRRAVSQLDGLTTWLGQNGIFYAYGAIAPGEPEELYKLGDMSAEANAGLVTGPIFVGHEEASEPRSAVVFGWTDSDPSYVVQKWYPHGDGTIATVAQKANAGNVFTQVYDFDSPFHVTWGHIFFAPITGGDSTEVATIKCYVNKSSTAAKTWVLTTKDLAKGFYYMPIGEKNVYSIQFEIEWNTSLTLGTTDFMPNRIIVDYNDTVSKKK